MTDRNDAAVDADVLGRWRMLAEQRLEYLTQLFESGRWRRYYGEVAFLEDISEAKLAVETWRKLTARARAEPLIRVSWPAQPRPRPVEPSRAPIEVPVAMVAAVEEASAGPVADLPALERALKTAEQVLDLGAIEQRYPLLRNAL